MREVRLAELRTLIADTLDVDASLLDQDTHFIDDLGVDSLMALEVMVRLERSYGVTLEESDLKDMYSLRRVQSVLLERQAMQG